MSKHYSMYTQAELRKGGRKILKMSKNEFAEKAKKFILDNCDSDWLKEKVENSNSPDRIINYLPHAIRQIYWDDKHCKTAIKKDFKGIKPDWENYDMVGKLRTVHGAPYIVMRVGGDWECPICIMVYHDGHQFRCYIPEKGNSYRKDIKMLFGNYDASYDSETGTYNDIYYSKMLKKNILSDDKYAFDQLVKDGILDKEKDKDKLRGLGDNIWYDINMCIEDFSSRVELNESLSVSNMHNAIMESIESGVKKALNEKKASPRKQQYLNNKQAKVGEEIICPICGKHFTKKQYSQAFCCTQCKDAYWNGKGDRHRPGYMHDYNASHPERLERIGIYQDDEGKFGHYDDDGNFWTFEEECIMRNSCEDPIEGR